MALVSKYRFGYITKKLQPEDCDIMYGQIGGCACIPVFTKESGLDGQKCQELNDETTRLFQSLNCKICGKKLGLIAQLASYGETTPNVHRVIYVYVCNSTHFPQPGSFRCLVLSYPYDSFKASPLVSTEQTSVFTSPVIKKNNWTTAATGGACNTLSFMSKLKNNNEAQEEKQQQQQQIKFNTRKAAFIGYDICSEENEEAVIEVLGTETEEAIINNALVKELKSQKNETEKMARLHSTAVNAKQASEVGKKVNLPKVVKNSLEKQQQKKKYILEPVDVLQQQQNTNENELNDDCESDNKEENENVKENSVLDEDSIGFVKMRPVNMLQRQEKSDFSFVVGYDRDPVTTKELLDKSVEKCLTQEEKLLYKEINTHFVHEFDLLSSIISHLEMDHKANFNNAEFESIHIWSPRDIKYGWSDGLMVVIEEDGIEELNKLMGITITE